MSKCSFAVAASALFIVGASVVQADLGLFIKRSWRDCDQASSCDTRLDGGCIPNYNFEIEGACYQVPTSGFSSYRYSNRHYAVNETFYCDNSVLFDSCDESSPPQDPKGCSSPSRIRDCPSNDPSRQEFFYIPDFCLETTVPVGDFVIPFASIRLYGQEDDCQVQEDAVYANTHVPIDPTLCVNAPAYVASEVVLGSVTRTCNPDGTMTTLRFTDSMCSEQSPALQLPPAWVVDGCTAPDVLPGSVSSNWRYTIDCLNPQYFCKDLKQLDFFSEAPAPSPVPDGSDNINIPTLGLFVDQFWSNWTSIGKREVCAASSCENRIQEGCIPGYRLLIEDACYQFATSDFSSVRSERFFPLNSTFGCGRRSDGAACAGNENIACYPSPMGDCTLDDPTRTERFYFAHFCIESSSAQGDYVVPFSERQFFGGDIECQAESPIHSSLFLPSDPNLCVPHWVVQGGQTVLGSVNRYCDAGGNVAFQYFTNSKCVNMLYSESTRTCVASNLTGTPTVERASEDCSNPRYFCKDLTLLDFFSKITPTLSSLPTQKSRSSVAGHLLSAIDSFAGSNSETQS